MKQNAHQETNMYVCEAKVIAKGEGNKCDLKYVQLKNKIKQQKYKNSFCFFHQHCTEIIVNGNSIVYNHWQFELQFKNINIINIIFSYFLNKKCGLVCDCTRQFFQNTKTIVMNKLSILKKQHVILCFQTNGIQKISFLFSVFFFRHYISLLSKKMQEKLELLQACFLLVPAYYKGNLK